ncbi:restriction endonuclease subunit S [Amygdalobacter nucleatus]|uniref:restriction endonuclease subunit S n=1 Tax=Amygdalobacter nucleatus TaxID=3029274 RepID=UPI00279E5EF1|nr:restriction endonuclease subunit S [Amygdalobacter nucleatus]WEG36700.1 restriction endonuclease subunit S [Amygdalobacter nucleatus]
MAKFELGKITKKIGSGFTPKGGKSTYCSKGIAFVRSQNILDMQFSKDGLVYISDKQAAKLKNVSIESDDVLLNITGDSVARACIMDSKYLPARVNQHVSIIRCDPNKIKSQYLLYYLQYLKKHLLKMALVGSTRKALTKEEISGLLVELPSIEKQKEITLLLESVRHKIQINKQINDNLAA